MTDNQRISSRRVSGLRLSRWYGPQDGNEPTLPDVSDVRVRLKYTFSSARHYIGSDSTYRVTVMVDIDPVLGWRVTPTRDEYIVRDLLDMYESLGHHCKISFTPLARGSLSSIWRALGAGARQFGQIVGDMDGVCTIDGIVVEEIKKEKK